MEFYQQQKYIKRRKGFPVRATKAYRWSGVMGPRIFNLCTIWKGTQI